MSTTPKNFDGASPEKNTDTKAEPSGENIQRQKNTQSETMESTESRSKLTIEDSQIKERKSASPKIDKYVDKRRLDSNTHSRKNSDSSEESASSSKIQTSPKLSRGRSASASSKSSSSSRIKLQQKIRQKALDRSSSPATSPPRLKSYSPKRATSETPTNDQRSHSPAASNTSKHNASSTPANDRSSEDIQKRERLLSRSPSVPKANPKSEPNSAAEDVDCQGESKKIKKPQLPDTKNSQSSPANPLQDSSPLGTIFGETESDISSEFDSNGSSDDNSSSDEDQSRKADSSRGKSQGDPDSRKINTEGSKPPKKKRGPGRPRGSKSRPSNSDSQTYDAESDLVEEDFKIPKKPGRKKKHREKYNDEGSDDSSKGAEDKKEKGAEEGLMLGGRKRPLSLSQIHDTDRSGRSRIFKYASDGDIESVQTLITAGVDVNVRDYAGWTALHEACLSGQLRVVEILVRAGADTNSAGGGLDTPLHDAVQNEHFEVVKFLLENGASTTAVNEKQQTPLDVAENKKIRNYLKKWSDVLKQVLTRDKNGMTPLHHVCTEGNVVRIKEYMKLGADLNAKDNAGWTPLHESSLNGHHEAVELLLKYGANVDEVGVTGDSALMDASANAHVKCVKTLLEFGADPTLMNLQSKSALDFAKSSDGASEEKSRIIQLLERDKSTWLPFREPELRPVPIVESAPSDNANITGTQRSRHLSEEIESKGANAAKGKRRVSDAVETETSSHRGNSAKSLSTKALATWWGATDENFPSSREERKFQALLKTLQQNSNGGGTSEEQPKRRKSSHSDRKKAASDDEAAFEIKSPVEKKKRQSIPLETSQPSTPVSDGQQPPVKRKRGRPRKNPLPEIIPDKTQKPESEDNEPLSPKIRKLQSPPSSTTSIPDKKRIKVERDRSDDDVVVKKSRDESVSMDTSSDLKKKRDSDSQLKSPLKKKKRLLLGTSPGSELSNLDNTDSSSAPTASLEVKPEPPESQKKVVKEDNSLAKLSSAQKDRQISNSSASSSVSDLLKPRKPGEDASSQSSSMALPRKKKKNWLGVSGYKSAQQMGSDSAGDQLPVAKPEEVALKKEDFTVAASDKPSESEVTSMHSRFKQAPLYALQLSSQTSSESAPKEPRYMVDLQVGLMWGFKSGRAFLDKHGHLSTRVATAAEKSALERSPLASAVYETMVSQGTNPRWLKTVTTPGGKTGLDLASLDILFLREDELMLEIESLGITDEVNLVELDMNVNETPQSTSATSSNTKDVRYIHKLKRFCAPLSLTEPDTPVEHTTTVWLAGIDQVSDEFKTVEKILREVAQSDVAEKIRTRFAVLDPTSVINQEVLGCTTSISCLDEAVVVVNGKRLPASLFASVDDVVVELSSYFDGVDRSDLRNDDMRLVHRLHVNEISSACEVSEGETESEVTFSTVRDVVLEHAHSSMLYPEALGDGLLVSKPLSVLAVVDPTSPDAYVLTSLLEQLEKAFDSDKLALGLVVLPKSRTLRKKLELPKTYRRFVLQSVAAFQEESGNRLPPRASFFGLPQDRVLTVSVEAPRAWFVSSYATNYDMDNVVLETLPEGSTELHSEYELSNLIVEGSCIDEDESPPQGLKLYLENENGVSVDTIVMANLGYFQLKVPGPGLWNLRLADGRSSELYSLVGMEMYKELTKTVYRADEAGQVGIVIESFDGGGGILLRVARKGGTEGKSLLKSENEGSEKDKMSTRSAGGMLGKVKSGIANIYDRWMQQSVADMGNGDGSVRAKDNRIHVFSVASGHLYERFLKIMMTSATKHASRAVKFWLLENYLSPSFKKVLPLFAKEHGAEVGMVTYKWPGWLRAQTEKQRIIWAYKILFLDVLFPLDVERIIFVDSDQVLRGDLAELMDIDLRGAPYGYVPFCDSRKEVEGYRFWKSGFWKDTLRGAKYRISALYVVDLKRFRESAAGDTLRFIYQSLSADPNSLSNLDQDLPNYASSAASMGGRVRMFDLPQEWLWCESWCDDESKQEAKAIDLCNNPMTKEPKLQSAKRIISEWVGYDEAASALTEKLYGELSGGGGARDGEESIRREEKEEL